MQEILRPLTLQDYRFLIGVIRGPLNPARSLRERLEELEQEGAAERRDLLIQELEHEIRYLGSSDLAYIMRKAVNKEPGASFRLIIRDTARHLKVPLPNLGTEREMLALLAQDYATQQFGRLAPEQQQQVLEDLGVERDRAAAFLKKAAGVFAAPVLIEAFGLIVVQGLIKTVIFGLVTRVVGRQLATRFFAFIFSRVPWWASWISPAAWTVSLGWAAFDLQGPARRKTIPIVLYLGLCAVRDR